MVTLPKPNVKTWMAGVITLVVGIFLTGRFYFARVAGNYNYAELIDVLDPDLQLNPPNLSIIIYTFGVILVIYNLAICVENIKYINIPFRVIAVLGQYSLDIFLWHIFIRQLMTKYLLTYLNNIWVRRTAYYVVMFVIPVLCRMLYNIIKRKMYIMKNKMIKVDCFQ